MILFIEPKLYERVNDDTILLSDSLLIPCDFINGDFFSSNITICNDIASYVSFPYSIYNLFCLYFIQRNDFVRSSACSMSISIGKKTFLCWINDWIEIPFDDSIKNKKKKNGKKDMIRLTSAYRNLFWMEPEYFYLLFFQSSCTHIRIMNKNINNEVTRRSPINSTIIWINESSICIHISAYVLQNQKKNLSCFRDGLSLLLSLIVFTHEELESFTLGSIHSNRPLE